MGFVFRQPVMFKHCDAAGIVFYPRYFEMINDCVELFFDQVLGYPFDVMHQTAGVPTVRLDTSFTAPSELGETLTFTLTCRHLGRTSLRFCITALCGDETRLVAEQAIVHVDKNRTPLPWPDPVRSLLHQQLEAA